MPFSSFSKEKNKNPRASKGWKKSSTGDTVINHPVENLLLSICRNLPEFSG